MGSSELLSFSTSTRDSSFARALNLTQFIPVQEPSLAAATVLSVVLSDDVAAAVVGPWTHAVYCSGTLPHNVACSVSSM